MKCAVYAYTPGWVAGVLHLVPALDMLVLIAALYGFYLLYLGLPVLMKTPPEKAVSYTVVVLICAIVLSIVLGGIAGIVGFAGEEMRGAGLPGSTRTEASTQPRPTNGILVAMTVRN
jgi:uncharacterized membrane protein